ncbi:MAG: acyl--CoA ligase, partial [Candidatus Aegiribacteria sp.]|nr:acyl--CoA ligase [Candidatus Aegiribacteria sp.]
MPGTLHELLETMAARLPDNVALEDDRRKLTYSDWLRVSSNIACLLQRAGAKPGYVIGVVSDRSALLPCAFAAISMIGARFVSLNLGWPVQERERVFGRWSDRLVLTGFENTALELSDENILFVGKDVFEDHETSCSLPDVDEDEEFYLNVTSASTGQAKIAPTTHRQLLANTKGVCRTLGLDQDDIHLSLFGVFGHPHELFMRGIYLGGKTVLTERRYPRDLLNVISGSHVTAVMALPTQLGSLSRLWRRTDADLSRVRIAEAGGMYVSDEFI